MTNEKWNAYIWKFSKAVQRGATTAEMLRSEAVTAEEKEVFEVIEKKFGTREIMRSVTYGNKPGVYTGLISMLKKVS